MDRRPRWSDAAAFTRDADAADELRDRCQKSGGQVSLHQADVGDPDACGCPVSEVLARYGRLDCLVNRPRGSPYVVPYIGEEDQRLSR